MSVRSEGGGGVSTVIPTIHLWALIADYEAAVAEASHVFNFPAIDFDDDSMLILVIDLVPTAALTLLMRINTIATANYSYGGRRIENTAVETLIGANNVTSIQLASAAGILTAATAQASGIIEILLPKAGAPDRPTVHTRLGSSNGSAEVMAGSLKIAQANITDIEILTSVSTWQVGTRITLYRVQRVGYQNAPI